ncbi:MAG TPA: dienelactone hydrolase family protein [Verrucomicrobiae bacterium]|jgi:carboxymethylenebutenolidase|nr:dienelactone hydrolase family protein [Verrucomicrobiae bacterium]
MKRLLLFTIASLITINLATAQDWAKARLEKSPRHGEWVKVTHDKRDVNSFITYPEVKDKATAVVVIHEIFGLSDWARSVTDEFAEAGYIAIAPDLLSGVGPNGGGTDALGGADGARKAIPSLPADQITADLNAVVDYVSKLPSCNGKVIVVGFCWGGGQSFRYATNNKDLKAALVFYGTPPDKDSIVRINCPVYGFYGGNDNRVTSTVVKATEEMKAAGKIYDPTIYNGAGHGFMRAGEAPDASPDNKTAHDSAWKRIKEILAKI